MAGSFRAIYGGNERRGYFRKVLPHRLLRSPTGKTAMDHTDATDYTDFPIELDIRRIDGVLLLCSSEGH